MSRALELGWVLIVRDSAATTFMIYAEDTRTKTSSSKPLFIKILNTVSVVSKLYGIKLPV